MMQGRSIVRLLLTAMTLIVLWNGYVGWISHVATAPKRGCGAPSQTIAESPHGRP